MTIAEIHVSHPSLILNPTIDSEADIYLEREFHPVTVSDGDRYVLFFSVSGDFTAFDELLSTDPTVTEPKIISDYGDKRVYRVRLTDESTVVTPKLAELGIQLLDVRSNENGWLLRVTLPNREALSTFKDYCDQEGITFQLQTMYRKENADITGKSRLTDKQRSALRTAWERGYFDDPRTISLQELAESEGVSPSAMGRRIRRATGRLVDAMLETDDR